MSERNLSYVYSASIFLFIAACTSGGGIRAIHKKSDVSVSASNLTLKKVEGCEQVERAIKEDLRTKMQNDIEENRAAAKKYAQDSRVQKLRGGCYRELASNSAGPNAASPAPNDSAKATEYTTTNNQVNGVDEADVVKNDGEFIYTVAAGRFLIVRAYPVNDMRIVSETPVEGEVDRIFVGGDRALIYSRIYDSQNGRTCGYAGYNGGYFNYSSARLKITLIDITSRHEITPSPTVEREIVFNSDFVGARLIGNIVHTVVGSAARTIDTRMKLWPTHVHPYDCENPPSDRTIDEAFDTIRKENEMLIQTANITDLLPGAKDIDHKAGGDEVRENIFAGCQNFYVPQYAHQPGYLATVSFPLNDDTKLAAAVIADRPGIVYASAENLYVATPNQAYSSGVYRIQENLEEESTVIHKFALDKAGEAATYRGSSGNSVRGHLVNQFAMDEYEGKLRVATSIGHLPDPNATNALYVLGDGVNPDTQQPTLTVLGAIKDLAKSEDIRSVRFDGNRGFMVTFKKTDPLFTFDLSIPEAPKVTGELKIPGFSTYMHFMDTTHLLTIGFDAADQGSFAWFTGIQLQIFDVSDMQNPKLVHKHLIGSRGTTSDATADHLAFTYMKSRDLLALPMGICEGGNTNGGYGSKMTFNGLMVFKVSAEKGFQELGRVDHTSAGDLQNQNGCYNWWQNPNSDVKRSIIMSGTAGDYVYSLSPVVLKATNLQSLLPQTNASSDKAISLPQPASADRCGVVY